MSDPDTDRLATEAAAYIDAFIQARRDASYALLTVAERARADEAARTLAELSRGPPRPVTPNVTIVNSDTPGVQNLGQIGLSQFTPDEFPSLPRPRPGGRRKSRRKSKSRKSRR